MPTPLLARRRGRTGGDGGAVLVELALAIVPMTMIAFGTVDLGRSYALQVQLRNAARAAANYARAFPTQVAPAPDDSGAGTCADPNNLTYQAASENGPTSSSTLPAGTVITVVDLTTGTTITGCGPDAADPPVVSPGDTLEVEVSAPFVLVSPLVASMVGTVTVHGTIEVVAQ